MTKKLDLLLIHPGDAAAIYQGLSDKFSAIETPTWCLLLAQSCRAKGYGVAILDCDAERLGYEEAARRIREHDPRLACFVVYGSNPNAGTTKMTGAVGLAKFLKEDSDLPVCFVGSHASALPMDVLAYNCVDFVLLNEGVYALQSLLATDLKTDLQNVKGVGWKDKGMPRLNEPERVVPNARMDVDLPGYAWDLLPYRSKPFDLYRSCNWHANFIDADRTPYAALYTSLGCRFKCFPAGTKVVVSNGPNKPIQKINLGDKLIAYDESTGKLVETEVKRLVKNEINDYFIWIRFENGRSLKCTEEHPFYVHGEWVEAKNLKVGDEIHSINYRQHDLDDEEKVVKTVGNFLYNELKITSINKRSVRKPTPVYNFECAPYNNYFVGCSHSSGSYLLSHNCDFCMINSINRVDNTEGITAADTPNMRFWSPDFIIKEFDNLASMGVTTARLSDEMFFLDKRYFEPLLKLIVDRGYGKDLLMWAYARVDTVRERYLKLFNDAGIKWLALGIECLRSGTRVFTSSGIKKIEDVTCKDSVVSYDLSNRTFCESKVNNVIENNKPLLKLRGRKYELQCSPEHRLFTLDDNCEVVEIKSKDLKVGDVVLSSHRDGCDFIHENKITVDQARLLGCIIGDGYIGKNGIKIDAHISQLEMLKTYESIANKCFDVSTHIYKRKNGNCYLTITGKNTIMKWIDDLGLRGTHSDTKFVPEEIQMSSNAVVSAFIAGLWDTDGCIHLSKNHFCCFLSFNNHGLLETVKYLLLYRLGIASSPIKTRVDNRFSEPKWQHTLHIRKVSETIKFHKKIPLFHPLKKQYLEQYVETRQVQRSSDYIFVPKSVIQRFAELNHRRVRSIDRSSGGFIRSAMCNRSSDRLTSTRLFDKFYNYVRENRVVTDGLLEKYFSIIKSGVGFIRITGIEHLPETKVYDLTIDKTNNYFANGFLVHNSTDQKIRKEITKGSYEEVDIQDVVKQIRDAGISVIANYIFGLPDDTYETMQHTLDVALEMNTEMANFYHAFALPGSPLYYQAKQRGWELPQTFEAWSFHSYESLPLPTRHLTAAEVLRFRDRAWDLYFKRTEYLDLVERKFGKGAREHVVDMAGIKLKRKLLE